MKDTLASGHTKSYLQLLNMLSKKRLTTGKGEGAFDYFKRRLGFLVLFENILRKTLHIVSV